MSGLTSALNIGKLSLLTSQKAIEVTGNNIANINTPGYSREVPMFSDRPTLMMKGVAIGTGVSITQVEREHDVFLAKQIQGKNADLGEESAKTVPLAEIERIINISENSLAAEIDRFFDSWQELTSDPGSPMARELVLENGAQLSRTFARTIDGLTSVQQGIDATLEGRIEELNDKFSEVAELNQTISDIESRGQTALSARDRRDVLLKEISYALGGTSIENADGMVSHFLPNGAPVVLDQESFSLKLVQNAGVKELRLQFESHQVSLGPDSIAGELKGLLTVRDQLIPGIKDELDLLAFDLANEVNQVHQLGTGLDGIGGRDFFVPPALQAGAASGLAMALADQTQVAAGLSSAPGDNMNALAVSDLATALLVNGSQTFSGFYGAIAGKLGLEVRGNDLAQKGNADALTQLNNLRDSKDGVSLEEEMISLIRYQNSFEASAKFLTTVDDMMETLLSIKR